jgi:hypothetical protein
MVWTMLLVAMALVLIAGAMVFWLRSRPAAASVASRTEDNVRIVSKFVSPSEDEALALVRRALANRDPAEVASLFRLGGASPAEVLEFIAGSETRDGRLIRCNWLSSLDVEDMLLDGVLLVYSGKATICERLAFLTPDDKGIWKVDFDAFARSSRPSWKDLLERRVDRAEVRVFVTRDVYFNGPFLDENQWVCVGMASPESKPLLPPEQELLHGYCRVGSPQAKAINRIFANGGQMNRMTVEIRRTEGADFRQFEITRVLAGDWVLPPKPFDEKFEGS